MLGRRPVNHVNNIYFNPGISFIKFTLAKLQGTLSLRSFDDSLILLMSIVVTAW